MKYLVLAISFAVLLCGCGGTSTDESSQDEAQVGFRPPMLLTAALEMARRHEVQPTELGMAFPMLGETISSFTDVESGMSDDEVLSRVREGADRLTEGMTEGMEGSMLSDTQLANLREVQRRIRNSPPRIVQMTVTGAADDLRAMRTEPGVEAVGLKSEVLERVRRAREGR